MPKEFKIKTGWEKVLNVSNVAEITCSYFFLGSHSIMASSEQESLFSSLPRVCGGHDPFSYPLLQSTFPQPYFPRLLFILLHLFAPLHCSITIHSKTTKT
jgi:hypothetical protein